jgi:hypothetical protein
MGGNKVVEIKHILVIHCKLHFAMQRILLFTLLFLTSLHGYSQNIYNSFVEKSTVIWAAYANDTFRFTELNLNLFLRDQLVKNKIEARLEHYENNSFQKVTIDSVKERIRATQIMSVIDSNGNEIDQVIAASNQLYDDTYFNEFTKDLLNVQQVIYLEDGELKSHVSWVSPMYFIVTSYGTKLGMSDAFFTAFNEQPVIKNRWKRNAIYLGKIKKKYLLNPLTSGIPLLKPMYGKNMLEAFWPSIDQKNIQFQQPLTGATLTKQELSMFLLDSSIIEVPIYDEFGEFISTKKMDLKEVPLSLGNIPFVMLEQEWFYLPAQNKLYSNILSIECWANKTQQGKIDEKPSPFLKIIQTK